MKRDLYQQLVQWKASSYRKPLILKGARQVGKTYLLQEFGRQEYEGVAYLNFDSDKTLADFFSGKLDPKLIIEKLQIYFDQKILPHQTLIIFDEVQEAPLALNALKYFNEQASDYHIVAAGSLLGVKMHYASSFPVGKVNFLNLFPLSFLEYLSAFGKENLRHYLESIDQPHPLPIPFHQELIDHLKFYTFIGGMPEAVSLYVREKDLNLVRQTHQEILEAYLLDFSKHAPKEDVPKITAVWETIPSQLAKVNKKFIFSDLKKNARFREYETSIQWLKDAGLIYPVYNISTPKFPLSSYAKRNYFKFYLLDVGLLGALSKIDQKMIVLGDELFQEFKGALAENLVAQELKAYHQADLFYWTSEGTAEIDFLVEWENAIYPLEVKSGINLRSKSLQIYAKKYSPLSSFSFFSGKI